MTTHTKEEIILKAENVHLEYDNKTILRNINFSIKNIVRPGMEQGQVVSLIGRSGIGKTQLFKLLSGLQQPTSGHIHIQNDQPVRAGDMGVIFQNYYLFEWRTIHQSLMLAAKQNPALKGHETDAIKKSAADFELTDHLQKYPQQLSGGQRQRASIIQQLLKGSDFLLLDEPFSGLDACVLDKVVELLLQVSISDELKTLVIVSHDIATAIAISDTVFILGKEKDLPGATIKKEIDLIARDLAWQKNIKREKAFLETVEEIKNCL
ncbi:ATP-binding cassette domain-containing protein [Chitinophagaceae bacterium LB-8]|uniref:ATP-binding cassette domain-containing protein n=1 Tax=Paraflavisolibacter caeni TaxID=2982496 RepID=A0A9X2XUL0_9BACT|nr:ATP-binding cassette domain-containing protein [Paraflavisolibacter caeni]MCU7549341.1 ATP-binding cassette domain-containing protein [Paraflavisolibacter caeni]